MSVVCKIQILRQKPHIHNQSGDASIALGVPLHNVHFVKYDVTVSFMAQVLDTVTYFVSQVLDTAS